MPWIYEQATGVLKRPDGSVAATGYSGCPECRNDPSAQQQHDRGPIPRGEWAIGEPFDSEMHGPLAMHLSPAASTETFGRGGFLIHGDSIARPGAASMGCVILPRPVRREIIANGDRTLLVA